MAQFVVESFANGLDVRRSRDTAPPGSLRTLRNCFINEGGEIEKRKAFVLNEALTDYGQTPNYKGRITGPHRAEAGDGGSYFFRHRHNSLPGGIWAAGSGSEAVFIVVGNAAPATIWAMRSALPLDNFGAMFRANSVCHFADFTHLIESFQPSSATSTDHQHIAIELDIDGEPLDETAVVANDNCQSALIIKDKLYVNGNRTVKASAVGDPTDMAGTGSGAFDVRTQSIPIGIIDAFGDYFGQLAVFGNRGVRFWDVDPNFAQNQFRRTVPIANASKRAIIGYGDGDLVFLGQDGIRSLRARDSSNVAALSDLGSPIDGLVRAALDADGASEETDGVLRRHSLFFRWHPSAIHPSTGQLWMFVGETVYVFSNYPGAGVKAWATFDMPPVLPANRSERNGPVKSGWCADVCQFSNDIMLRNYADEVFIYGGPDGSTYDDTQARVITPHMDLGKPGTDKHFRAVDLACIGEWTIEVSIDPTLNPLVWEEIATVENSTHRFTGKIPMDLTGSHIALRLTSRSESAARVAQLAVYFDEGAGK